MKTLIVTAFAAATLACAATASAQEQAAPYVWRQVAISGGCLITIPVASPVPEGVTVTWDHVCTPGVTVRGEGTIRLQATDGRAVTMLASWIDGVPNGTVTMVAYDAAGTQLGQQQQQYNMGCEVAPNTQCVPYQPS